jgi:hypothetical protein
MPTPISSIVPVSAASPVADAATPDLVLQAGSVVDARVVSVLADNLVRIAIANLSMDVMSEVSLTPGQNLQLAVSQNDGTIRLAVVNGAGEATADQLTLTPTAASLVDSPSLAPSATTARNPLTPTEQVALTLASAEAATKQGSQAPLFANLASVVTGSDLPAGLKQAVLDVLAQQTPLNTGLDGGDIQSAFQKSGLFLEASLAAGATPQSGPVPDLKAALLVLRQTLAATSGTLETGVPQAATQSAALPASTATPQTATSALQVAGEAAQAALPPPDAGIALAQLPRDAALAAAVLADMAGETPQAALPRTMSASLAASLLQEVTQNLPRMTGYLPGASKAVPRRAAVAAIRRLAIARAGYAAGCDRASPARRHRRRDRTADPAAGCLAARSRRCQRPSHRSDRAAMEFRDSVCDPTGHRDGAVRDLARRRQRVRRSRQARLACAILAQCRAGRARARADHAQRRQDLCADVGRTPGDRAAAPRRRQ